MLKILFQYLTDSYALLENPVDNYIIMGVVGGIAFLVAYSIVGWFYDEDLISGSRASQLCLVDCANCSYCDSSGCFYN